MVAYPIVRLRGMHSLRRHVEALAGAVVATLAEMGIEARAGSEKIGVWVGEAKIASIGVAVDRWVSFHGLSLNVAAETSGSDQASASAEVELSPDAADLIADMSGQEGDESVAGDGIPQRTADSDPPGG